MQTNYKIDTLKQILQDKKQLLNVKDNQMEMKKVLELEKLFNNDRCFFNISIEAAINILHFLGIPDESILETYKQLTDPKLIQGNIKFK